MVLDQRHPDLGRKLSHLRSLCFYILEIEIMW